MELKAEVYNQLDQLKTWLSKSSKIKYSKYYQSQIDNFISKPIVIRTLKTNKIPDGSPIGSIKCDF